MCLPTFISFGHHSDLTLKMGMLKLYRTKNSCTCGICMKLTADTVKAKKCAAHEWFQILDRDAGEGGPN